MRDYPHSPRHNVLKLILVQASCTHDSPNMTLLLASDAILALTKKKIKKERKRIKEKKMSWANVSEDSKVQK